MINLMIVTNSKYLRPTYLFLYSFFEYHDEVNIFLPYEDIKDDEIKALERFVDSFGGRKLHPLYVGEEFKKRIVSRNGISVETYYRILGIEMLPKDMDRILYMDVDIIVKGSMQPFYDMNLNDKPFAVCEDIFGIINGFHEGNKKRLNIPFEYTYFNAGVMLYNLDFLRKNDVAHKLIENIYKNYERYEYNDQDVINEMFYDRLIYAGWDEYNCPPAWYYIDKGELQQGRLKFVNYDEIKKLSNNPQLINNIQNITTQIYEGARVIHYLGDTKPWSETRKEARIYEIFDKAYNTTVEKLDEYLKNM